MEFILLKGAFVSLTVLEILSSFAIKHAIVPISLILAISTLSVQNSPTTLYSIPELSFIPTSITPPKSSSSITFSCFKLSFINITLFSCPIVNTSSFLFIKPEFSQIIIPCSKIQFSLSLQLPIMKLSRNYFMGTFKETNTFTMWTINFRFTNIRNLSILEKFRVIVCWLHTKYNWGAIFNCQQFLQPELNNSQFSTNKATLVIQIIKIKLSLLEHFFLRGLVYFQFATHATNEKIQSFIHFVNRLELASFNLFK